MFRERERERERKRESDILAEVMSAVISE